MSRSGLMYQKYMENNVTFQKAIPDTV